MEGPGILRVRNEAFKYLGRALDLPGGAEQLVSIDVDHATPVLPLDRLAQSALSYRLVYGVTFDTAGAGSTQRTLSFAYWTEPGGGASWDFIRYEQGGAQSNLSSGDDLPFGRQWDTYLVGIGAFEPTTGPDATVSVQKESNGWSGPRTPLWVTDTATIRNKYRANGNAFVSEQPPLYWDRDLWDLRVILTHNTAGGNDVNVVFEVVAIPPGLGGPIP